MTESQETALATTEDHELVIQQAGAKLQTLAETKDEDLKQRIMVLAQLTHPEIQGIEGEGHRARLAEIRMKQPMSNSESIPSDCKNGELYNTDGVVIGNSLRFIPVLRHPLRKKWADDNKLDCISLDGTNGTRYGKCAECPYSKFEQGKAIECSPGHTFYVVTPELDGLYRIDFQKSSAKAGRNIIKLTRPPALWAKSFELSTEHITANNRNYYQLITKSTGHRTDEATLEVCELIHEYFKAQYMRAQKDLERFNDIGQSGDTADSVVVSETEGDTIDFGDSM